MTVAPEPTAGQRYVEARSLRAHARTEVDAERRSADYLLMHAGPDPWNARRAAGHKAAADLWQRVEQMAQEEMDRWRDEARQYQIDWGDDE